MNYQAFKKFFPKSSRGFLKKSLLKWHAWNRFPSDGYVDYIEAARQKSDFEKSSSQITIRLNKTSQFTLRSRYTDLDIFEQIFLLDDCKVPIAIDPEVIIDAGAHIGCSSVYFALKYPTAKI